MQRLRRQDSYSKLRQFGDLPERTRIRLLVLGLVLVLVTIFALYTAFPDSEELTLPTSASASVQNPESVVGHGRAEGIDEIPLINQAYHDLDEDQDAEKFKRTWRKMKARVRDKLTEEMQYIKKQTADRFGATQGVVGRKSEFIDSMLSRYAKEIANISLNVKRAPYVFTGIETVEDVQPDPFDSWILAPFVSYASSHHSFQFQKSKRATPRHTPSMYIYSDENDENHMSVLSPGCFRPDGKLVINNIENIVCSTSRPRSKPTTQFDSACKNRLNKMISTLFDLGYQLVTKDDDIPKGNVSYRHIDGSFAFIELVTATRHNVYAERLIRLNHVIDNFFSYDMNEQGLSGMLISTRGTSFILDDMNTNISDASLYEKLQSPREQQHFYRQLLEAVLYPSQPKFVSNLTEVAQKYAELAGNDKDVEDRSGPVFDHEPFVLMSMEHSWKNEEESIGERDSSSSSWVCFSNLLMPLPLAGGQLFVSDSKYPSHRQNVFGTIAHDPDIPRDSVELRAKVSALHFENRVPKTRSKVVFINPIRQIAGLAPDRQLDLDSQEKLEQAIEDISFKHGFHFSISSLGMDEDDFLDQARLMRFAAITMGVHHPEQMISSIFMPPLSVLIEILPYNYFPSTDASKLNAGLKYYSYRLTSVLEEYPLLANFSSVQECLHQDPECSTHYRSLVMQISDYDLHAISDILDNAMNYLNGHF